jgi:hypothetical protein
VRIRYLVGLALAFAILLCCSVFIVVVLTRGWNISRCPHCQSHRIRSSWPTSMDKILYRTYVRPYRCEACQERFYAFKTKRLTLYTGNPPKGQKSRWG